MAELDDVQSGLYLVVDGLGNLRWLGQADRDGGVGSRLREHLAHPEREQVYGGVYVSAPDPFSPHQPISATEGKAADPLGLRGKMGLRTWP